MISGIVPMDMHLFDGQSQYHGWFASVSASACTSTLFVWTDENPGVHWLAQSIILPAVLIRHAYLSDLKSRLSRVTAQLVMRLDLPSPHVRAWYSYAFAAEVFSACAMVRSSYRVGTTSDTAVQAIFLPITLERTSSSASRYGFTLRTYRHGSGCRLPSSRLGHPM